MVRGEALDKHKFRSKETRHGTQDDSQMSLHGRAGQQCRTQLSAAYSAADVRGGI